MSARCNFYHDCENTAEFMRVDMYFEDTDYTPICRAHVDTSRRCDAQWSEEIVYLHLKKLH
jgi:hypothetical protein